MSQENVEIVRRIVEAFQEGDVDAAASVLDDEMEFESAVMELGKTYKGGMAGLIEFRRDLDDAWGEFHSENDRFFSAGSDTVLHLYRIVGRGRGSSTPVAQDIAIVWTLRAGQVVRGKVFLQQHDALKAVGLEE